MFHLAFKFGRMEINKSVFKVDLQSLLIELPSTSIPPPLNTKWMTKLTFSVSKCLFFIVPVNFLLLLPR